MTQVIETLKENRWKNGKRFLFLMNINAIPAAGVRDVVICVGDENIIIEKMSIEANVENMTWQAFAGTQYTEGTGTVIAPIPRNSLADTESMTDVNQSPTVTNDGQSFTAQPLNLVAQIYRNNNYYMNEDLLSSDFIFKANQCYLIRLTNTSADTTDVQFSISTSNT